MSVGLRVCTWCGVFALSVVSVSADAGELLVKRRVPIESPSMEDPPEADVRCEPELFIDEHGVPFDVRPDPACPEPFAEAIRTSLLQWRYFPPRDAGERVRARTTIGITFDTSTMRDQAWRQGEAPPTTEAPGDPAASVTIPCPTKGEVVHYELNSDATSKNEAGEAIHHIQFREILRLEVTSAGRRKAKLTYRSVDNELSGAPDTVTWNVRVHSLRRDSGTLGVEARFQRDSLEIEEDGAFCAFTARTRQNLIDVVSSTSAEEIRKERSDDAPVPPGVEIRAGLDPVFMSEEVFRHSMSPLSLASCGVFGSEVREDHYFLGAPSGGAVVPAPATVTTAVEGGGVTIGMRLTGRRRPTSRWRDLREVRTIRAIESSPWPEWEAVTTYQQGDSTVTHTTSMRVVPAP